MQTAAVRQGCNAEVNVPFTCAHTQSAAKALVKGGVGNGSWSNLEGEVIKQE